jgi:hypothetical protein
MVSTREIAACVSGQSKRMARAWMGPRPEQWRVDYWFLVQLAWFLFPWISTSQMYARAQNYS